MTTYYVRKTGSDSNNGLSAGAAFLTLGKLFLSATGIVGGDIIYVGAGIYRETIASGGVTLTSPSSEVQIIGDIDGAKTGDPGEVLWTPWTTSDVAAPASVVTCNLNSKDYFTFSRMRVLAGTSVGCFSNIGNNCTFRECVFETHTNGANVLATTAAQTAAKNLLIERCIYIGHANGSSSTFLAATFTRNSTAHFDANIVVKNCLMYNYGVVATLTSGGAGSFYGSGVKVLNCTLVNGSNVLSINNGATTNANIPNQVLNCVVLDGTFYTELTASGLAVAENIRTNGQTALAAVTSGLFSLSMSVRAFHWDFGQGILWGLRTVPFSPYPDSYGDSPLLGNACQGLVYQVPATAADDATVGTISWTNPNNAIDWNDGASAVATAIPATTGVSHYLKMTGGVGVPSGATIKGVRADILGTASVGSSVSVSGIKLVKAGTIGGNDLASSNTTTWNTTATRNLYGSAADPLWGNTLTDTDVNAANFGVAVAFKNVNAATRDMNVQGCRLIVSYELAGDYYEQTVDLLNRPRPSGLNVTYTSIGALEVHDHGTKEVSVTNGGTASLKLTGPGDQQFQIPVDAVSTTISVDGRYDTTHGTGAKPQLSVLDSPDIGVTAATTTMTVGVDTWETISLTFTPSAKGIVTIRLRNRAAAASGLAYFDNVVVS
jgi:hypothetical protein